MSSDPALSKRIKRHVIGRIRPYFAATAPGFESLCLKELQALGLPLEHAAAIAGGVEFSGRLTDCYQANLHLRTANRILMRIDQFQASNFRQVENKAADIPWELYLPSGTLPQISVKTRHCRLYHTEAIAERFLDGLAKHQPRAPAESAGGEPCAQTIFIRGADDRFTVSLDSSGDHLHKRGLKKHPGHAPLRETTAAAALLLAGYRGQKPLIDPMCGTGTFSLEAAMMAENIPAGFLRQFAFMGWPSFRRSHWEHLKSRIKMHSFSRQVPLIFASDTDPSACRRLETCLTQHRLKEVIDVRQQDFFDFRPQDLTDQSGWVVLNPPYGRRLESRPQSDRLFMKICTRLKQSYQGWELILIAPNPKLVQRVPFTLDTLRIAHGGLRPVMMFGTIS
jgi:putative N6-adenine-specific DNA methylase